MNKPIRALGDLKEGDLLIFGKDMDLSTEVTLLLTSDYFECDSPGAPWCNYKIGILATMPEGAPTPVLAADVWWTPRREISTAGFWPATVSLSGRFGLTRRAGVLQVVRAGKTILTEFICADFGSEGSTLLSISKTRPKYEIKMIMEIAEA